MQPEPARALSLFHEREKAEDDFTDESEGSTRGRSIWLRWNWEPRLQGARSPG